jgi:hypothetical protein
MKVAEPRALGMKTVEVGRLQMRVPRAGQIAPALVVSDDENDIWPTARERPGLRRETKARSGEEEDQAKFHRKIDRAGAEIGELF